MSQTFDGVPQGSVLVLRHVLVFRQPVNIINIGEFVVSANERAHSKRYQFQTVEGIQNDTSQKHWRSGGFLSPSFYPQMEANTHAFVWFQIEKKNPRYVTRPRQERTRIQRAHGGLHVCA